MTQIMYYISSHGFGHSTRAIEIVNHIPDSIQVEIVTKAPRWLFESDVRRPFTFYPLHHDPGIMQLNCLQNDVERTYECWNQLLNDYPRLAREEAVRLRDRNPALVVGDISPFTVAVAEELGLPSLIVANFSWDWIFSVFLDQKPAFQDAIDRIRSYYHRTTLLLRTPFAGDLSVFPAIQDIPLVVRRSQLSREEARCSFGLHGEGKSVLISFGGMGMDGIHAELFKRYEDITFLTFDSNMLGAPNVRFLDPQKTYHPDIVRAVDLVLTKLGYGIVTECIAHQTPIAFPPRAGFLEYEILREGASRSIPLIPISESDFYQGKWDFLDAFFSGRGSCDISQDSSYSLDGGRAAANVIESISTQQMER